MNIKEIEIKYLDKNSKLLFLQIRSIPSHRFFPKTKNYRGLNFRLEFVSIEGLTEFTMFVIYKEIKN